MKSPLTGKEMTLVTEKRTMDFRKERFQIVFHYYKCEESGEQFTTTSLDEINLNQLYNQYRDKFNIPFPDEIAAIRQKYSVSASKIAEILGFGTNSYRQYEAGEMPSVSNARLIQMISDPNKFIALVSLCDSLDEKTKEKYTQKAKQLNEESERNSFAFNLKNYLLGNHLADIYSGYRNPSFEKFTEMVVYFSEHIKPYKTKMNKLLFYADFLMFKQSCFSISGVRYHAIDMGPVPYNFQSVFEYLGNKNEVDIHSIEFPNGGIGEQFIARTNRPFNSSLFSELELDVLKKIVATFKTTSTNDIIELSHLEKAWKENEQTKNVISYEYAFALKQI
jgi:putative zinc finger/helix-turn-helix YgiT family protein